MRRVRRQRRQPFAVGRQVQPSSIEVGVRRGDLRRHRHRERGSLPHPWTSPRGKEPQGHGPGVCLDKSGK